MRRCACAPRPATYRDLAERAWAWSLSQVRSDEHGWWLPERPDQTEPGEDSYGMHSGSGGLAHAMAEIRLTRPLSEAEEAVAAGIAETLAARIPDQTGYDYIGGVVSTLGVLTACGAPGPDVAVARLLDLATSDGSPNPGIAPPRAVPEGRFTDATLGTAAVLLGALWAMRYDVPGAASLNIWHRHGVDEDLDFAVTLADAIVDRAIHDGDHSYWRFVEHRNEDPLLPPRPGWMQGAAGIAALLFRLARLLEHGRTAPVVARMDTWWALR